MRAAVALVCLILVSGCSDEPPVASPTVPAAAQGPWNQTLSLDLEFSWPRSGVGATGNGSHCAGLGASTHIRFTNVTATLTWSAATPVTQRLLFAMEMSRGTDIDDREGPSPLALVGAGPFNLPRYEGLSFYVEPVDEATVVAFRQALHLDVSFQYEGEHAPHLAPFEECTL